MRLAKGLSYQSGTDPLPLKREFDETVHKLELLNFNLVNDILKAIFWREYIPDDLYAIKQTLDTKGEYSADEIVRRLI
jgi:hypothetical protein